MTETRNIPLRELTEADYNPRKISKAARARLRASLERFGVVSSLTLNVRTGRLVGGHQRASVLRDLLGPDAEVPVSVVDLSDEDEKALNISLNRQDLAGSWDASKLDSLLEELSGQLPDLRLDDLVPSGPEADRALADAIRDAPAWSPEPTDADREILAEKLASHVRSLPLGKLRQSVAVLLPMHRGTEPLLVVADPALSDFLTELYRAARAGAPSPLSVVADKLLDLEEDAA